MSNDDTSQFANRSDKDKVYSVVIGIVTDNVNPDHAHMVKVRFPHLPGGGEGDDTQDQSDWVRIGSGHAGHHVGDTDKWGPRGVHILPEIGDEVLVLFRHGDFSDPVVIGRAWSDVAPKKSGGGGGADEGKPNRPLYSHTQLKGPLAEAVEAKPSGHAGGAYQPTEHRSKKNDLSGLRTRAGHLVIFNDNLDDPTKPDQGKGGILVRTASGHRLELLDQGDQGIMLADSKGNYVWLRGGAGSPKQSIEIKTTGDINLESTDGNVIIKAKKNVEISSDADTKHTAKGKYDVQATGEMKLNTNATGTISAATMLQLTGKPINLN